MMIYPANSFIFQHFSCGVFQRGKRAKNNLKLPISECFALYLRKCRSYHHEFENIYRCFALFFLKKFVIVNIKIILFLLASFNSFFNHYLFFKFINKCQKEILRCAPTSSHVCDFFYRQPIYKQLTLSNGKLLSSFQVSSLFH